MRIFTSALLVAAMTLAPIFAGAAPVTLRLNHWGSSEDILLSKLFMPWADAVSKEAPDAVNVQVFPSGALGNNPTQQAQLVLDGVVDIGFVVPGFMHGRFPENEGLELPDLFKDLEQASTVRTKLLESGELPSFKSFFVIGLFASPPLNIYTHKHVASVSDLKGLRIRAANASDSDFLKALGAVPVFLPLTETVEALGRRTIDGASVNPETAIDFGVVKVTENTYRAPGSTATLALVMSREKFDSLPAPAQNAIRKYSGMAFVERYTAVTVPYLQEKAHELSADPHFTVVDPSPQDLQKIQAAAKDLRDAWAAKDQANAKLLQAIVRATGQ